MSARKNTAYVSHLPQLVMHAAVVANSLTHFFHRLHGLVDRLVRWRNEKSHPSVVASFELGNERFAETGYYRVSAEQAMQEHTIDIHTVNLLQPRIR